MPYSLVGHVDVLVSLLGLEGSLRGGLLSGGLGTCFPSGLASRLLGRSLHRLLLHLLHRLHHGLTLSLQRLDNLLLLEEESADDALA